MTIKFCSNGNSTYPYTIEMKDYHSKKCNLSMSVSLIMLGLFLTFGFIVIQSKHPEHFGFKKWDSKPAAKKNTLKHYAENKI